MKINYYYFDTSALFKRYLQEQGTALVDKLFSEQSVIYTSNLTVIEVISNLKRLMEIDQVIDLKTFNAVKDEFFKDIGGGIINIEPVTSHIIISAVELINEKYITPIDSLQLATAVILKERYQEIEFVCADYKLSTLARKAGLNVLEI